MKTLNDFLFQYGGLSFTKTKFRPGVGYTTNFGLDNTFNALRIHNAIDRGNLDRDVPEKNPIYAPFDCEIEYIASYEGGFGSLLRMKVEEYGFEVRVMHTDSCLVTNGFCKAGTLVAYAGTKGIGTGRHTHTEVVSLLMDAPLLEEILLIKTGGNNFDRQITIKDVEEFFSKEKLPGDPVKAFNDELAKRQIIRLYQYSCLRRDYFDGKIKTFYSSKGVFDF